MAQREADDAIFVAGMAPLLARTFDSTHDLRLLRRPPARPGRRHRPLVARTRTRIEASRASRG